MGDESGALMAVVEGAIAADGGASAAGDLFLTDAGLWFFSYADAKQLAGPAGAGSAAVAGVITAGVVGGVLAYQGQKKMNDETYRRLVLNVDREQALRFGLSLEERLKGSWRAEKWARFIPRDSIAQVLVGPGRGAVTCVTGDGVSRSWVAAPWARVDQKRLEGWAARMNDATATGPLTRKEKEAGNLPDPRAYGLGLSQPLPRALIETLARGECPCRDDLDAIKANNGYLASLYWNLVKTPRAIRVAACRTLAQARFSGNRSLRQLAKEDLPRTMGCAVVLLLFLALFGIFLTFLGWGLVSSYGNAGFGLLLLLLGLFSLGFVLIMPVVMYLMPARTILRALGNTGP